MFLKKIQLDKQCKKHKDMKLITPKTRRDYLCHDQIIIEKMLLVKLISNRNEAIQIFMDKPVFCGIEVLEINNSNEQQKFGEKSKLYYLVTSIFAISIKQKTFTKI